MCTRSVRCYSLLLPKLVIAPLVNALLTIHAPLGFVFVLLVLFALLRLIIVLLIVLLIVLFVLFIVLFVLLIVLFCVFPSASSTRWRMARPAAPPRGRRSPRSISCSEKTLCGAA